MQVDEESSLWAGSSTGIIVVRDDMQIAPSVFTIARDDGVVAGTPVVHQERNERGVVLEDGVWLRTVAARMTSGEGAEVPAVVPAPIGAIALLETAALPTTTALPHGP